MRACVSVYVHASRRLFHSLSPSHFLRITLFGESLKEKVKGKNECFPPLLFVIAPESTMIIPFLLLLLVLLWYYLYHKANSGKLGHFFDTDRMEYHGIFFSMVSLYLYIYTYINKEKKLEFSCKTFAFNGISIAFTRETLRSDAKALKYSWSSHLI